MKYEHLSVDIETLSNKPGGIVLNVAAVPFTLNERVGSLYGYWRISVMDSLLHGLTTDPYTLAWWRRQSCEAFEGAHYGTEYRLDEVAGSLFGYIAENCTENVKVWMKGPGFDGVMLAGAFEKVGRGLPWKFWNERCVRTICDGVKEPDRTGDVKHCAIDDAYHQAKWVRDALMSKEVLEDSNA